jgi:hypothetical protein
VFWQLGVKTNCVSAVADASAELKTLLHTILYVSFPIVASYDLMLLYYKG